MGTRKSIRAVLFDVGGPLDTETIMDREIDEQLKASFRARGASISDDEYDSVAAWAVEVFAPRTYDAIIWKISGNDRILGDSVFDELYATVPARNDARGRIELRPGIAELLEKLSGEGLLLGLAANQPQQSLETLSETDLMLLSDNEVLCYLEAEGIDCDAFLESACSRIKNRTATSVVTNH